MRTKIEIKNSPVDKIQNHQAKVNEFCHDKTIINIETFIHHNFNVTSNGRIISVITYTVLDR